MPGCDDLHKSQGMKPSSCSALGLQMLHTEPSLSRSKSSSLFFEAPSSINWEKSLSLHGKHESTRIQPL